MPHLFTMTSVRLTVLSDLVLQLSFPSTAALSAPAGLLACPEARISLLFNSVPLCDNVFSPAVPFETVAETSPLSPSVLVVEASLRIDVTYRGRVTSNPVRSINCLRFALDTRERTIETDACGPGVFVLFSRVDTISCTRTSITEVNRRPPVVLLGLFL